MEKIGKYALVGQIGTGGFGVVWEGLDPHLKRRVAIKTCTSELPEIRDRFFREAEIAGNLQHRNIVTVFDCGLHEGVPYLVQEYLSGEDLDRKIARGEAIPAATKVDWLVQVARGLAHAHREGVIHRDVKPANVRVTESGLVKIMDFGIAKLANATSHLTRTGMALGTAGYLPPEQIQGHAVDHRADVFSFGVLAYELLGGRRPFAATHVSALLYDLLNRPAPPLAEAWPECPPRLAALVARCLEKRPDDRFPSFAPIVEELEAVAEALRAPAPAPDLAATQLATMRLDDARLREVLARVAAEQGQVPPAAAATPPARPSAVPPALPPPPPIAPPARAAAPGTGPASPRPAANAPAPPRQPSPPPAAPASTARPSSLRMPGGLAIPGGLRLWAVVGGAILALLVLLLLIWLAFGRGRNPSAAAPGAALTPSPSPALEVASG